MTDTAPRSWIPVATAVGIVYAFVGIVFAIPTTHVQNWRIAAWVVSAVAFAAHIAYERLQRKSSAGLSARHVAFAVAMGAFALAVRANVHEFTIVSADQQRTSLLVSLVLWPLLLGVPAFVAAYCVNIVLARTLGDRANR